MFKTKKIKNHITTLFAIFAMFFVAVPVFAADLFFEPQKQSVAQGQEFLVSVFLDTKGESINALEGAVRFPSESLELKEIRDGNSIITFWIERAKATGPGAIAFSGITPGGFQGGKEFLFSLVLRAKAKKGSGSIELRDIKVLLNDGNGTQATVATAPFRFSVSNPPAGGGAGAEALIEPIADTEPPENFVPEIAHDENIFDGKYFLIFATQDKGSGIDRYEIREGAKDVFRVAESPSLLQNQELDKKIFVKAVDKAGNERIAVLYPPNYRPWYQNYWLIGILIVVILILGIILRVTK